MNRVSRYLKQHAPDILAGISIVGVVAIAYTSRHDTLKAQKIMEKERPVTKSEKAECYIRAYWPTGVAVIGTAACIIFSRKLSTKQLATMIAAATAVEERFSKYRDVIKEEFGDEKERELYIQTAKENLQLFPELPSKTDDYDDSVVFFDMVSQTYFISSIERVQQAMYHLNRNFVQRGWACANEYLTFLGIKTMLGGDEKGWEVGDLMESGLAPWIDFFSDLKTWENGTSYYIIGPEVEPSIEALECVL